MIQDFFFFLINMLMHVKFRRGLLMCMTNIYIFSLEYGTMEETISNLSFRLPWDCRSVQGISFFSPSKKKINIFISLSLIFDGLGSDNTQ